jgi:hypothetical protein
MHWQITRTHALTSMNSPRGQLTSLPDQRRFSSSQIVPTSLTSAPLFPAHIAAGIARVGRKAMDDLHRSQQRVAAEVASAHSSPTSRASRNESFFTEESMTFQNNRSVNPGAASLSRVAFDSTTGEHAARASRRGSAASVSSLPGNTTSVRDYWARREDYVRRVEDFLFPPYWQPVVLWKS